jgi:hypothetical protein
VIALAAVKLVAKKPDQPIILSTYRYEHEWQARGLDAPEHALSPVWFRGRRLIVTPEHYKVDCVIESVRIGDDELLLIPMPVQMFLETGHHVMVTFPSKAPGVDVVFGVRSAADQSIVIAVAGDVHV